MLKKQSACKVLREQAALGGRKRFAITGAETYLSILLDP